MREADGSVAGKSPARLRLTERAHAVVLPVLGPGGVAIDATVGAGRDTEFLAASGARVFGYDVQEEALSQARRRLAAAGLEESVTLIHAGHEDLERHLPAKLLGRVSAAMFNLGYLPGGDKSLVTVPGTTVRALTAASVWLKSGGVISVVAYRGHRGGADEYLAVRHLLDGWRTQGFSVRVEEGLVSTSPVLIAAKKA